MCMHMCHVRQAHWNVETDQASCFQSTLTLVLCDLLVSLFSIKGEGGNALGLTPKQGPVMMDRGLLEVLAVVEGS